MAEQPLYKDDKLKIDYHPSSHEDHLLWIKDRKEGLQYILQRGILHELATTPRGGIESKLSNFNPEILFHIKEEKIGIDGLHVAICQAYAEEEDRVRRYQLSNDSSA